jgi:hypothetical protein
MCKSKSESMQTNRSQTQTYSRNSIEPTENRIHAHQTTGTCLKRTFDV